ncbi:PPE domain-containing protein [Nocardia sp. NPDC006044]|uniref:PPE domain-containing protein n=1 Tax=Nocardia sp. NPDC006044 TaxID=3364306 RepID=UPI0036937A4E
MIEPPKPGFTGVVWEARPPERLARDLTTGPGSVPMAEAAAEWARLATVFGAAVLEYERVLASLRTAWQSGRSGEVMEKVTTLRDWLVDAAGTATANAARLQAQVAAYEVAKLTMPNTADIQQIQQVQEMLKSMGAMLGAPIQAIAADNDADADVAKAVASRVMRSYETAAEPLATPWQHQEPPKIAPEQALAAEQAATAAAAATPKAMPGFGGMPIGSIAMPTLPPRALSAYRAPVYSQSTTATEPTTKSTQVNATAATGQSAPVAPGAMGGAGGGGQDSARFPRASLAGEADQIGLEGEIQAAPAVLGGTESVTKAPTETRAETGGAP